MIFIKRIDNPSLRKCRLLYLMGATWHTKCMFDLSSSEESFATILHNAGIETYAFDISMIDHKSNVDLAVNLINEYQIDYVLGYSYGCATACDVATLTNLRGIILLDPESQVKVNKRTVGNTFVLSKLAIKLALAEYGADITEETQVSYINAISNNDKLIVPTYPRNLGGKLPNLQNIHLFLTKDSTEEYRACDPNIITYYPNSGHWILIEPGRYQLAQDIENLIKNNFYQ